MGSKDMNYWKERQEETFLAGEKKVKDYYKELERAFEQAKKEIQSVINDFYARYADENGISYTDAQKSLDNMELGDLKDFIELVDKSLNQYNQKLNNMSIKARITRYQALEKQIDAILQRLYAIEYQYKGEETLKEVYSDSYYRTWFNIDQYHGFHKEFAQINSRTIEELIKYPWSGADFSTRIWKQKDHMLQKLNESITTMIIQGKNPSALSKDFAKIFKTKEYEAYRLLYTEGSFIIEQATLQGYKEDGVKKYQILATLDMKTSDICRSEDGKIYDVYKAVVGVNYPPYHPFCRTTITPYYEDEDYSQGTRIARDPKAGETYEVPADMNYKQWYDRYITKKTEQEYKALIGLVTSNNLKITGISDHIIERAIKREVSAQNVEDALINTLRLGKIKKGKKGNSQEYLGEYARVIINPDTGNMITVWKTSTKLRKKLKGVK